MSNIGIFKEMEKEKLGDFYTLLCLRSAEFSKAFGLRNLCYSKISAVMFLGYRNAGISQNQNDINMTRAKSETVVEFSCP